MSPTPQDEPHPQIGLAPLTPATIQRAKEGLAAARNPFANQAAQESLRQVEAIAKRCPNGIAQGSYEEKLSGDVRSLSLRFPLRTLFKVRIQHPERIPTTPAILAPNHLSHFDPLLILSEVPARPYYHIIGDARTLYNKWWKRQFLGLSGGVIPLDRLWKEEIAVIEGAKAGREDLADLAAAVEQDVPDGGSLGKLRRLDCTVQAIFARGDGIIMFPEGGLGTLEGSLRLPLKRGAAIYALRGGVPIVPIGITGTQDLYFRKELTIAFGEPLIFPQSDRPKPGEVQEVLDALTKALMALLPKNYRLPPGLKLGRGFLNRMLW